MQGKTVLVVENDEAAFAKIEAELLRGKVQSLRAKTLIEGWRTFFECQKLIWLIMVSCHAEKDVSDTMTLVSKIRKMGFTGDIIAYSDDLKLAQRVGARNESTLEEAACLALKLLTPLSS